MIVIPLQVAIVLCMSGDQGDSYGPRYLFPLLLPLTMGAAAGLVRARAWLAERNALPSPRAFALGVVAVAACGLLRAGVLLERHRADIEIRSGIYRAVDDAHLSNAVVIVKAQFPTRFTRNGPTFDGPVIYVSNWGVEDHALARLFPQRAPYVAELPEGGSVWSLHPLTWNPQRVPDLPR
jgi:hypothetical protein